jgi:hypothetical protein
MESVPTSTGCTIGLEEEHGWVVRMIRAGLLRIRFLAIRASGGLRVKSVSFLYWTEASVPRVSRTGGALERIPRWWGKGRRGSIRSLRLEARVPGLDARRRCFKGPQEPVRRYVRRRGDPRLQGTFEAATRTPGRWRLTAEKAIALILPEEYRKVPTAPPAPHRITIDTRVCRCFLRSTQHYAIARGDGFIDRSL